MPREPTSEAWAQIRYDYEHTERPIEDICIEHGVSSGTLRDRMRRWRWTRRRTPIPGEGPPPAPSPASPYVVPFFQSAAPTETDAPPAGLFEAATAAAPGAPSGDAAACLPAAASADPPDPAEMVPRLHAAVARVLPAIEAIVTKLAAGPMPAREMEQAARALGLLTRTLRELNGLLMEHPAAAAYDDDMPKDIDAYRVELARRIDAFVASRAGEAAGAEPPAAV